MIATDGTVGPLEWIIDGTRHVLFYFFQDCPQDSLTNSTCISGASGGFPTESFPDKNCSSLFTTSLERASEHLLLCFQLNNSPSLGHFYEEPSLLKSSSEYEEQKGSTENVQQDESEQSNPRVRSEKFRYKFGSKLKTFFDTTKGIVGDLNFPQKVAVDGTCRGRPVEFLKPQSSDCIVLLSPETCAKNSANSLNFELLLAESNLPSIYNPQVTVNLTGLHLAPLKVQYFSSTKPYLYTKRMGKSLPHFIHSRKLDITRQVSQHLKNPSELEDMYERPDALPIIKRPPGMFYDEVLHSCENIVLEAQYKIYWQGSEILGIEANILLGNVSIANDVKRKMFLTQSISITFHHESDSNGVQRSGSPGYNENKPVLSGFIVETGSGPVFHSDSGLRIWNPSPKSLCRDASSKQVEFGVNMISGCMIQLSKKNFSRCQALKEELYDIQQSLVTSKVVAKGGDPEENDFVDIIWSEIDLDPLESLITTMPICDVPSDQLIEITYTQTDEGSINRISGVRVTLRYQRWQWLCDKSGMRGSSTCEEIQNFELRSQTVFHELPLIWKFENTSR